MFNLTTNCLIKLILLIIAGVGLTIFGFTMYGKKQDKNYIVLIACGLLLLVWAYFVFNDPACQRKCDSSRWSSKPLVVPSSFNADQEDITICQAQKWAQENSVEGFIACMKDSDKETYDVMFLSRRSSYEGVETACTDCQIYYTDKLRVNLAPYSPKAKETSAGCPMNPYPYCPAEDIQNVYVNLNCHASKSLVDKLIDEGKIEDINDPKIVKCCETPDVCRAKGIKTFPTVTCKNDIVIQGFCP
jgi:hypothetical protein